MGNCIWPLFLSKMKVMTSIDILLYGAAEMGDLLEVTRLLALGANPQAVNPNSGKNSIEIACVDGNIDLLAKFAQHGINLALCGGLLFLAVQYDRINIVRYLVSIGANVNEHFGLTSILIEGLKNYEITKILLDAGAEIKDSLPLIECIKNGFDDSFDLLIKRSDKIYDATKGITPLGYAIQHNKINFIEKLNNLNYNATLVN